MAQFTLSLVMVAIRRVCRAAAFGGMAVFLGCGRFDAAKATPAQIFSNKQVRALAEAAESGDVVTIDRLAKEGVDVNAKGRGNVTPLLRCFFQKNKEGYQALLRHGADPNVLDADGHAVTHRAAAEEDPIWLRVALEYGANPNLVNKGNRHFPNSTPLYYAIRGGALQFKAGRPESVKLLIAAKADLNHIDASRSNPLLTAVLAGNYEIVFLLLEAGADFRQRTGADNTVVEWIRRRAALRKEVFDQVVDEEQRPWFFKCVEILRKKGASM